MRAMLSGTALVSAALIVTACAPPIEPEEMDIFQASYSGETSRVQTLLERGADPDFKSQEGYPSLVAALSRQNFESAELLYDYGADVNATVPSGATIYDLFDKLLSRSVDYSTLPEGQSIGSLASPPADELSEEEKAKALRDLEAALEDYEYVPPTADEYYSLKRLESVTWTPDSREIQPVLDWLTEHGACRRP